MPIRKHLCGAVPIQNCLKQRDISSPQIFYFVSKCVIRKVQENLAGLKLNGTHQLLAYADDVNLLEDNMTSGKTKI
jgi:hypothetical protein